MIWPHHPDGSPKKLSEMTESERAEQFKASGARIRREFTDPRMQAAFDDVFGKEAP